MERRGQFYMIDAFFAAIVLFLGVGIIVATPASAPPQQQLQQTSNDITRLLVETELQGLSTQWISDNREQIDFDKTPAQQILSWHQDNIDAACAPACPTYMQELTESLLSNLASQQFGVSVTLTDEAGDIVQLYERTSSVDTSAQIVTRQIIFALHEDTNVLGPAVMEVRVWA